MFTAWYINKSFGRLKMAISVRWHFSFTFLIIERLHIRAYKWKKSLDASSISLVDQKMNNTKRFHISWIALCECVYACRNYDKRKFRRTYFMGKWFSELIISMQVRFFTSFRLFEFNFSFCFVLISLFQLPFQSLNYFYTAPSER